MSPELWEKIFMKRQQSLWQISLCIVLFRFQLANQSHFHHEQPSGSSMKKVPGMGEIVNQTLCSRFDMCQVGAPRDPRFCPGTHQHRPNAGQTVISNKRVPLSKFTEQYPIKFARQVAKVLMNVHGLPICAAELEEEEHPTKKRRLIQKMSAQDIIQRFSQVNWQTVMTLADRVAPRVGTMVVDSGPLIEVVQQVCPNHQVKHLVLCHGTDRYVGPNETMFPGEAPLRRMACIRRKVEDVQVDPEWEPWERWTQKGRRRKSWPAASRSLPKPSLYQRVLNRLLPMHQCL